MSSSELEQNPLLERDEPADEGGPAARCDAKTAAVDDGGRRQRSTARSPISATTAGRSTRISRMSGSGEAERAPRRGSTTPWGNGGSLDDGDFGFEQVLSERISLREHLRDPDLRSTSRSRRPDRSPPQLDRHARRCRLSHRRPGAGRGPARLRGVSGSRPCSRGCSASIRPACSPAISAECLALQLRERNRLDPAMQALLDNLELLARRDFAALQTALRRRSSRTSPTWWRRSARSTRSRRSRSTRRLRRRSSPT